MTNPIIAIAARNRPSNHPEQAFGRGRVTVRGSRGTAYGWATVNVDWTPLDADQSAEMRAHCFALLRAAHIDLGTTWTDDDCQHTMTKCHLSFNAARYYRTMRHADGTMSVLTGPYRRWRMDGAGRGGRNSGAERRRHERLQLRWLAASLLRGQRKWQRTTRLLRPAGMARYHLAFAGNT